jgi:hypothetical protein
LGERLFNARGLGLERALKMAACMDPALSVGQSGLFRIALVSGVAVGQRHRSGSLGQAQCGADVVMTAREVEREAHLVELAVEPPEVAGIHLAVPGTAGLDRGLIHGLDPALQHRGVLGLIDRGQ